MHVYVVGAGRMGSQIAVEYALGGHRVSVATRNPDTTRERLTAAGDVATRHGLATADQVANALAAATAVRLGDRPSDDVDLVVESVEESLDAKAAVLAPLAGALPEATIATNTSSLSVTALGDRIGASVRTLGTHYWNPPLLMPLVEVIRGEHTDPDRIAQTRATLVTLGKKPVLVERDAPGFVWNRLQFALLREAIAIVEDGTADAMTVDTVVSEGLGKRWHYAGPFQTAALGGAETFQKISANLFPVLSPATDADGLTDIIATLDSDLAAVAARRDLGLAREAREEREARASQVAPRP